MRLEENEREDVEPCEESRVGVKGRSFATQEHSSKHKTEKSAQQKFIYVTQSRSSSRQPTQQITPQFSNDNYLGSTLRVLRDRNAVINQQDYAFDHQQSLLVKKIVPISSTYTSDKQSSFYLGPKGFPLNGVVTRLDSSESSDKVSLPTGKQST